jgi:hypothetical protein
MGVSVTKKKKSYDAAWETEVALKSPWAVHHQHAQKKTSFTFVVDNLSL